MANDSLKAFMLTLDPSEFQDIRESYYEALSNLLALRSSIGKIVKDGSDFEKTQGEKLGGLSDLEAAWKNISDAYRAMQNVPFGEFM